MIKWTNSLSYYVTTPGPNRPSASSVSMFKANRRSRIETSEDHDMNWSHDERPPEQKMQDEMIHDSTSEETVPLTIKFGASEISPVCLQLHSNGTGFVRWAKAGSIACSLENGRLFASYQSGAIAVVLDSEGSGCVSSPDGQNLLTVRNGSAAIYGLNGVIEKNIQRAVDTFSHHSPSQSDSIKKQHNIDGSSSSSSSSSIWMFDGMRIDFIPETWEVRVTVNNDTLVCEFSRYYCKSIFSKIYHENLVYIVFIFFPPLNPDFD